MGSRDEINKEERKCWLWVADSRSWLDEDGKDEKYLDPSHEMDPENDWWTCNRDVLEGDLALLWRTRRGTGEKSDIGYLMEVKSEAHFAEDPEYLCALFARLSGIDRVGANEAFPAVFSGI